MAWIHGTDLAGVHTCGRILVEAMRAINEREKAIGKPQTVFKKYPTEESLGVPDGGVNIPALDALDFSSTDLDNLRDLREAVMELVISTVYVRFWSGFYDANGLPIPFDDNVFSPYNLLTVLFGSPNWRCGTGFWNPLIDWAMGDILIAIQALDQIVIHRFGAGVLGKAVGYQEDWDDPEETWAECVSRTPTSGGIGDETRKSLRWSAYYATWIANIQRHWYAFATNLQGKSISQVKWYYNIKACSWYGGTVPVTLQFYKTGDDSPPIWNPGTELLWENTFTATAEPGIDYQGSIALPISAVELNDHTYYCRKIKNDESYPTPDYDVRMTGSSKLLVKPIWIYPGEIIV